jgi:DNA ligase (NAD+)
VESGSLAFENQSDVLDTLPLWGLKTQKEISRVCNRTDELLKYHRELEEQRDELPYEIDGVVFKVNGRSDQEALGFRARDPRWAVAYKFKPREATTKLLDITIQVGRTGRLTPVAELEPVRIGGVEVKRASLHNQSEIERKDIRIGDTVVVVRAGDVIPQVEGPITAERDGSEKKFKMPKKCPICNSKTELSADKKSARCPNLSCSAQLRQRLFHYASRSGMDIEGLGSGRIDLLVDSNLVVSILSLYELDIEQIADLDRMGERSAQKLLAQIEESKTKSLHRFIFALGIPLVGVQVAGILVKRYSTIDDLLDATRHDLESMEGIGPEVAGSIIGFFESKENRDLIESLRKAGLTLPNEQRDVSGMPFEGFTFVFTGSLEKWSRKDAEGLVASLGGRASASVSKKVTHVVAGPGAGSKLEKARKLGLSVLSEDEFTDMMKPYL